MTYQSGFTLPPRPRGQAPGADAMTTHVWLPYFEWTDLTVMGEDWPTYSVARWERNEIGETRFTGEARIYSPAEAVAAERARLTEAVRGLPLPVFRLCECKVFTEVGDARGDTIGKCDACGHRAEHHDETGCTRQVRTLIQPEAVRDAVLRLIEETPA